MIHAPTLQLRERSRKRKLPVTDQQTPKEKKLRQTTNPKKCKVKDQGRPKSKLAAAINCARSGPHRFVRIADIFPWKRTRIRCKWQDNLEDSSTRCQNFAEVACFACGTEFCFAKVAGRNSNSMISHASAAHQPQWFHLAGPKVFCLKK